MSTMDRLETISRLNTVGPAYDAPQRSGAAGERQPVWPLVGLGGSESGGKDACTSFLVADLGYRQLALADNVCEALLQLDPMLDAHTSLAGLVSETGWDAAKRHRQFGPEVRRLLQAMGTETGQGIFSPTVWTDLLNEQIRTVTAPVVVSDLRLPQEADWIRGLGGSVIRVLAAGHHHPGTEPVRTGETDLVDQHPTEAGEFRADYTIVDDSTPEVLRARVLAVLCSLSLGIPGHPDGSGLIGAGPVAGPPHITVKEAV